MNVHKLSSERVAAPVVGTSLNFEHSIHSFGDAIVKTRTMRALDNAACRYPVYRTIRCAARRKLEDIFDDVALHSGLSAHRLREATLLLEGADIFIQADGWRTATYSSCVFSVWASSLARIAEMRDKLFELVGERYPRHCMFTLDWNYMSAHGLGSTSFDELVTDAIYDESYPILGEPVRNFVARYLDANETVLVLLGAPGTGKTRLVRAILGAMSDRKEEAAKVMYTADKKALENDEIFVDFITGSHDAFVIEDADHLLLARSGGNHDLHRFLMIADGVVRAQGRKIIFTTNLPNVLDIDDALTRPGRCYAIRNLRNLTPEEARTLARRICAADMERAARAETGLFATPAKSYSVAQVWRACGATSG